ncbi:MAG: TonB-dependent receptor plug domain-containing protein [Caulobacteraceae bacterium]
MRLLASSMICGAAALAFGGQALAQDAQVEELVVTGSRIPQPNLTSTSPITVVGDTEIKLQGTTNVEQLVNSLPAAYAGQTGQVSNGASGTATVDLRGLGPNRTLVLVDGRRLMPGSPILPVADLNAIPAAMIDRVEVVTGGASAVYGSDAVSGVVNFIMKKDFEGVRLDAQYSFATHSQNNDVAQAACALRPDVCVPPPGNVTEGETWDLTAIVGVNAPDGRGNVTAYAGYRHQEPVLQSQYDYTACVLRMRNNAQTIPRTAWGCAGSANYNIIFATEAGAAGQPYAFFINNDRTFTPYAGQQYNYGPTNYLQRPDERYTLGSFAHYEITPMFDVYLDSMFADDKTIAQIAPSGAFLDRTIAVNCDNPFLSDSQRDAICTVAGLGLDDDAHLYIGRRNIEGGPRQADLRHTSYRIVLGSRGDLGDGWRYDVYGQYGTSVYSQAYLNEFSVSKFKDAIQATTDGNGNIVCISGNPGCVPYDLFGGLGGISQGALDYIQDTGFQRGRTEEQIVSGLITGDLGTYGMKSPWASDGVGIALGAEYRREFLDLQVSSNFLTNDLWGQGGATPPVRNKSFDVKEVFGEIRVPIVADMPFFNLLQFEGGYRHSEYSSAGATDAWKLALDWAPIPDVRFRGSLQRAVRAPNILELFTPANAGLFGGGDPCAGAAPKFTAAQCALQGVTAAQYGSIPGCPAGQCRAIFGGNENLKPEESDTKSIGVVITPSFFRGFNMSVDYYDIEISDAIQGIGAQQIMAGCSQGGIAAYCDLITRSPNGNIFTDTSSIININQNVGSYTAQGVDVEANYRTSFADMGVGEWGSLSFNYVASFNLKTEITNVPGVTEPYDCAGYYGTNCGVPYPEYRHRFRATWGTPWDVQLSLAWRHIGSVDYDGTSSQSAIHDPVKDILPTKFDAYNYIDLSGTWTIRDGTTLRVGVNNVFDKDPPLTDGNKDTNVNGNTYPQVYDALGRTWFIGITADF